MDKYIGISIYAVYGDDFIEPITKEHAVIKEKKEDYYMAEDDNGIEFAVNIDDTFDNLDFAADVGTEYRVFTDESNANSYYEYLIKESLKRRSNLLCNINM